ncbi:hypothetical protein PVAP13_9NG161746 [Panicum virgatum]|uniref:Uncharacterized protein n=1 Tax=Panicum virgatum TaxID=38727 RepID=A0A8T0MGX2_PANVG|nr:hypothetical protein PVAP13_9NG161746 [Panicum virgatum]
MSPRALPRTESSLPGTMHASVQINIGHLDENGLFDGRFTTFGLSRFARAQGDADRLWAVAEEEGRDQAVVGLGRF